MREQYFTCDPLKPAEDRSSMLLDPPPPPALGGVLARPFLPGETLEAEVLNLDPAPEGGILVSDLDRFSMEEE